MITFEELFQKDSESREKEKERNKQRKRASQKSDAESENKTEPQDSGIECKDTIVKDKLQDKVERNLSENVEEVQSSLLDNWKPYLIKDLPLPEFYMPSNTYPNAP